MLYKPRPPPRPPIPWALPTLDRPYDEWRMSSSTGGPPGQHNLTGRLEEAARRHKRRFHAARPFKHAVIDGLLPAEFIDAVAAELPAYLGSGVHLTGNEGYLNVHADFNRQRGDPMQRRVNMFIYLTPGWQERYGGHLELWSRGMDKCEQRILPRFGRFVVFRSDDFSYHGHPVPMRLPPKVMRRSIAFYYYTKGRPMHECINANCNKWHSTLFKVSRCGQCAQPSCGNFSEALQ